MTSHGILVNGAMAAAWAKGDKTCTRRLGDLKEINERPDAWEKVVVGPLGYKAKKSVQGRFGATFFSYLGAIEPRTISVCPVSIRYTVGSEVWGRETWRGGDDTLESLWYRASGDSCTERGHICLCKWRSPMFMPRKYSRLVRTLTSVRVERLQDITEEGAMKEGITKNRAGLFEVETPKGMLRDVTAKRTFEQLWTSLYGPGSWDKNVWVVVLEW